MYKFKLQAFHFYFPSLLFLLSCLAFSCSDDEPAKWSTGGNGGTGNGSSNAAIGKYTSRIEVPALEEGNTFIQHSTLVGTDSVMTYCLEYNPTKGHSRWVAFRFDATTRKQVTGRNDSFADDPALPTAWRIGSNGFGSGYDRGHLCASADRLYSVGANVQTFYMTNMSPQLSRFNQNYWVVLEAQVQKLGRSASFADTLYVVKGGTIDDDHVRQYLTRPNGLKVAVPQYYFMALLSIKSGTYESVGFWMEHKDYGYSGNNKPSPEEMAAHMVTIDRLEELTGIDFFHNLPDKVETAVEDHYLRSRWIN